MASIQIGGLITGIKGKMAGMVFGNGSSGPTVRRYSRPARRARSTQSQRRSIFSQISRAWTDLTAEQVEAWKTWADGHPQPNKFGDMVILAGNAFFMKLNTNAMRLTGETDPNTDPPIDVVSAAIETFAVTPGTNPGEIDLDWTLLGTGLAPDFVEFQIAGPWVSEHRNPVFLKYEPLQDVGGDALTSTQDGLVEEMYYYARARYTDQYGQTTNWHYGVSLPEPTA